MKFKIFNVWQTCINFYSVVADCDHQVLIFKDFGREFIKENKLSPDSFIQIIIQLAYYK